MLAHPDIVSGPTKLNMTQDFSHFAFDRKENLKIGVQGFLS